MKILWLTLLIILIMLPQGAVLSETPTAGARDDSHDEHYRYESMPAGKEDRKEKIDLSLSFGPNGVEYVSTMVSAKSDERITIRMTEKGNLISAARTLRSSSGDLTEGKIWRDENKVYLQQGSGTEEKTIARDIPEGATLVVEGSLLILLRFFPYDTAERWDLFVIDFSGRAVTATVRQTGIERITVPAGEFSCYRMEVLFHVFILSPKVFGWVTTENPHIAVKRVGKRGIFTPTYLTTLVAKQ